MKPYRIISDGSCDMPEELAAKKNVTIVPFYVTMDERTYLKEGVDISKAEFYRWMLDNPKTLPRSSTPSVADFLEAFTRAAEAGEDVLCICITKKFSSSCDVAETAAGLLAETHPETKVRVINAMVNTVCQALVVLEAARIRDMGADLDRCAAAVEAIRPSARIFFTIGSMDYLRHGGRIGKLAGIAGSILGIRPLITLKEGEIFPSGLSRSRKPSLDKVMNLAVKYITATFKSPADYSLVVGYGADFHEAVSFRDNLMESLARVGHKLVVPIFHIGAVISVHTGPLPLGVAVVRRAALA